MNNQTEWSIYIIRTINDMLYTGITTDVERRFVEHMNGKIGSRFLKHNPPQELVYTEIGHTHSSALKREREIKKLSRLKKEKLIQGC